MALAYVFILAQAAGNPLDALWGVLLNLGVAGIMVIISSYPGKLYNRLYRDWERVSWTGNQFCHAAAKRTECVWLNPAAIRGQSQMRFAYFQKGKARV